MKTKFKQPQPEKRMLPVKLTAEEIRVKSDQLADACADRETIQEEKKDITASYATKLKFKDAQISMLSKCVSTKNEYREVECHWHLNRTNRQAELRRVDTGETVDVRALKCDDDQLVLDDSDASTDAAASAGKEG